MLFSADSIWTMLHGIVLGGGALMGLAVVLFCLRFMASAPGSEATPRQSGSVATLTVIVSVLLWLTVIGGTYIVFPPYRATPPEGTVDLTEYPRSFLLGNPDTAWLHAFAMETKEHVPWMVAMLATAAAFVAVRNRSRLLNDPRIRGIVTALTLLCFVLAAYVALLGVFVNKVAPLD
jgi:uncharacterized membrane protein